MRLVAVLAVAAAANGAWSPVFGSSLTSIGVLDPAQPYSEVRAVSSDGSYVVGASKEASGTNVPIVWSSTTGLVALPNPSGLNSLAHGVAVGISANAGNIMISGLHDGNTSGRFYEAPLSSLNSGSWTDTSVAGGLAGDSKFTQGTANDLRNQIGGDGRWYTGGRLTNSTNARFQGDPDSGWAGTAITSVGSVSGYGVNAGRSKNSGTPSVSSAFYEGPDEAYGTVPGSTGYRADGFGISPSFGKSASLDFDLQWICGQVQNFGDGTFFQAFRWKRGDASMTFLGALPGDTSSVAYTVADNGVTAGRSHNISTGVETAVVWDTSGTWDSTGTAKPVQDLLNAAGVDTSAWTRLARVYAASDDGSALAGFGIWAADSTLRGFVAVKTTTAAPVLRITSITVAPPNVTVVWSNAIPGTNYTLQHKQYPVTETNINSASWYDEGTTQAVGTTASLTIVPTNTNAVHLLRVKYLSP
jgi:uncharacterized membrane protein